MQKLKIAVIGAGAHSSQNHLPALARYQKLHPEALDLVALCDLRREHAEAQAAAFGFQRVYTAYQDMLSYEQPDGCIAVTPIPVTAQIAKNVMRRAIPLVMEKPPGATVNEAQQVCAIAEETKASIMVSMNRRFTPALRAGLDWKAERTLTYVRGTMVRHHRCEPDFMTGTAIHAMDTLRTIAGDVQSYQVISHKVAGVRWYVVDLAFDAGICGTLEILPDAGHELEVYELFGPAYRIQVHMRGPDAGQVTCWEQGQTVHHATPARHDPPFVINGTYDETAAFIAALRDQRPFAPTPKQVLQSVELCHAIQTFSSPP